MQAFALTTLDKLKGKLGISGAAEDSELEFLIESQSERFTGELCRGHLHYDVAFQDVVDAESGASSMKLSRVPVLSITTIEIMGSDGSFSAVDVNHWVDGRWIIQAGCWAAPSMYASVTRRYRITCAAGWITPQQAIDLALTRTLPRDIEAAVLELCMYEYHLENPANINVKSKKMLSVSKSYDVRHMTQYRDGKLPPKTRAAVRKYRWVV